MKRSKILLGTLLLFVILTISGKANASSFSIGTSVSKTTIAPGEETVLTIRLSNIDMGNNGIKTLTGYLEYDEKKFEVVTRINGIGTTPWSWTYNNSGSQIGKFTGVLLSQGEQSPTAIGTITLKARSDATEGVTTVTLKNLVSSDGLTDISTSNATTNITIKKASDSNGNTNNNNTGNNINNNNINNNSNEANEEHPYAGKGETIGIIATALVLSILGYKMYSRYHGI